MSNKGSKEWLAELTERITRETENWPESFLRPKPGFDPAWERLTGTTPVPEAATLSK